MNMIEKVARAICEKDDGLIFDTLGSGMKGYYMKLAIAAMNALKEPTDAMVESGVQSQQGTDIGEDYTRALGSYFSMIDKALDGK